MDWSQLEQTIRTLLEQHLPALTGGANAQAMLAHKLAQSLQNNLRKAPDNMTLLPDTFTLVMHPEQIGQWQSDPQILHSFKQSLLELAQNLGMVFASPPNISLAANPGMATDEIDVIASHRLNTPGETQSMAAPGQQAREEEAPSIPEHAYLLLDGGRVFKLRQAVVNLGRRLDNHVVLNDPRVSRNHAQLRAIKGRYVIFDLNSTGGTYVNGQRVSQSILYSGDVISLAGATMVYRQDASTSFDHDTLGTQPLNPTNATDVPTAVFKTNPDMKKS